MCYRVGISKKEQSDILVTYEVGQIIAEKRPLKKQRKKKFVEKQKENNSQNKNPFRYLGYWAMYPLLSTYQRPP